ncbi:MAG: PASTA domain-containing protein [Treponema sp.]|jgi:beta-lactam-binding protein with PASTA domain|nr:PASTA domain-containing protein [Treponema sp.]
MGLINLNRDTIEGCIANHLRLFVSMAFGLMVFVGVIAASIFFIAVRGAEQTMVPDVRNKELTEALLELQTKELYPRIQLRYSQSSWDKGLILEQEPRAGTIVKAGRRIRLVVSRGVMISKVENYLGRNIDEVRMELRTLAAELNSAGGTGQPLFTLREPFMYEYSSEPAGLILQQSPEPGTGISGPTALEFVVSRGPRETIQTIPGLTGLSVEQALARISQSGINFIFSLGEPDGGEGGGTVTAQEPGGNSQVSAGTQVHLTVSPPEKLEAGEIFAIFRYRIPENPYPLSVRLEALLPSGERRQLITVNYRGGEFTVPYRLPVGTELSLFMLNREMHRETIAAPLDTPALDRL